MGVQVTLQDIQAGFLTAAAHTANNTLIEAALDKALDRTGSNNNAMEVNLDMGGQRAINLANGLLSSDAATLGQLQGAIGSASSGLISSQTEVQLGNQAVANVFTFSGITYTVGGNNLYVFRNGQKLGNGEDYTETSSASITLTFTPNDTDRFEFVTNIATTTNSTTTASVAHTQYGVTNNLADYLVNRGGISVVDYGADPTGAVDSTAAFVSAEAAAEGKVLIIPEGTYIKDRTFPKSNTTFWFEPGVTIQNKTGGNNNWRFSTCDNVHFYCNGATFTKDTSGSSHNIYFEIATNCSLRDANVVGAAAAKDCIYVGGGALGTYSENITITGGSAVDGNRNCISVVSAKDTIIENMVIHGALGAPGSGVDLEANEYEMCERTIVRDCEIYNNQTFGIVSVFSDEAWIYNNYIHDNGDSGVATAAGGVQFDSINSGQGSDRYRIQDLRGVGSFDLGTGTIGVTAGGQDSDIGLDVGTIVQFRLLNGATLPPELQTQSRWVVSEKVGNNAIKVSEQYEHNEVGSLTNVGTGTLTLDPDTSDIQMICYVEGQNSNFHIYNNILENNGTEDIDISTCVNFSIRGNIIRSALDRALGFRVQLSKDGDIEGNKIYMDRASTVQANGISIATSSNINTRANEIYFASGEGITVTGCSRGRYIDDLFTNCGRLSNRAFRLQSGAGAKLSPVIRQDTKTTPTNGLVLEATTSNCLVTGADLTTAGTSNATSLVDNGTGNRVTDTRLNDGTFAP